MRRRNVQPTRCREWLCTGFEGGTGVPAWERIKDLQELFNKQSPKIEAMVAGKETCPTTGNPHLQIWILFKQTQSFEKVRRLLNPTQPQWANEIQPRLSGSSAWRASNYCRKGEQPKEEWDEMHEEGPNFGKNFDGLLLGDLPKRKSKKGKSMDLQEIQKLAQEGVSFRATRDMPQHFKDCIRYSGLEKYFNSKEKPYEHHDVRGLWLHGMPNIGKSHILRELLGDENIYTKDHNKWFDDYKGEKWILIDDVSRVPKWDFERLKGWADKYGLHVEVKNAKVYLRHKGLVATSNYTIEEVCDGIGADEVLRQALLRRFVQLELTAYNVDEIRSKIIEWRNFHDCSLEEQEEHKASNKDKYERFAPHARTLLKEKRCPNEQVVEQISSLYEIEQAEGDDKIRMQEAFDRLSATWNGPVYEPDPRRQGRVPVLKRLSTVPTTISISPISRGSRDEGSVSVCESSNDSEGLTLRTSVCETEDSSEAEQGDAFLCQAASHRFVTPRSEGANWLRIRSNSESDLSEMNWLEKKKRPSNGGTCTVTSEDTISLRTADVLEDYSASLPVTWNEDARRAPKRAREQSNACVAGNK